MFDWLDEPVTKLDLFASTVFLALVIFGAFDRHREKTAEWLPELLKSIRDDKDLAP